MTSPAVRRKARLRAADSRHTEAERLLIEAESAIRLIDRVTPLNLGSERARLSAALAKGGGATPRFEYAPAPNLSPVRHRLLELARSLESGGILEKLLSGRAEELAREAALIDAIDGAQFRALAAARFRVPSLEESEAVCEKWLAETPAPSSTTRIASDDAAHPESLISRLNFWISERKLQVRVELRSGLSGVAAAGDGFVAVRPHVRLPAEEAERIALHELEAHVLPRLRSRGEQRSVFRVGCRDSGEHEEGRALLIEERSGLMRTARRHELAARHRAAAMVRAGADLVEVVRALCRWGVTSQHAIEVATRVLRGGGLAREIVYVPAYLLVRAAFIERPELERYFERGRVSLEASRLLCDADDSGLEPAGHTS